MGFTTRYLDDQAIQANNADTFRSRLPFNQKISAIDVRVSMTNGATSGVTQVIDALTSINVVDGAKPIFSVFPRTALALTALITKARAPQVRDETASAVQEILFRIPFGRYLGDQEYYLDTAQWANPEIRIPFAPAISATAFATGTVTFSTRIHYWDGDNPPPPALGFYRWVEALNRTSLASGDFALTLPMDKPLLGVMVYSREAGIAFETDLVRIRLLDDIAGNEIRNIRAQDGFASNQETYNLEAIERGAAFRQDAGTIDTDCNFLQAHSIAPLLIQTTSTDILVYTYKTYVGDRVTLSGLKIADSAGTVGAAALDTTNRVLRWQATGRGLPHSIYVALADWEDPASRFPFKVGARPQLILTEGGADADQHITPLTLGSPT